MILPCWFHWMLSCKRYGCLCIYPARRSRLAMIIRSVSVWGGIGGGTLRSRALTSCSIRHIVLSAQLRDRFCLFAVRAPSPCWRQNRSRRCAVWHNWVWSGGTPVFACIVPMSIVFASRTSGPVKFCSWNKFAVALARALPVSVVKLRPVDIRALIKLALLPVC